MAEEMDNDNANNYETRKSFVFYDPYNPEASVQFQHIKFEEDGFLRASLVLDVYKQKLLEIKKIADDPSQSQLSTQDKEQLEEIINVVNYLGDLKIIDADVLLKLYNMYRMRL